MQPEAAIINAALVPDLFAVHLSAHKALQASSRASLRTRSLHAELVFGISGSKHVRKSAIVTTCIFWFTLERHHPIKEHLCNRFLPKGDPPLCAVRRLPRLSLALA